MNNLLIIIIVQKNYSSKLILISDTIATTTQDYSELELK